MIPFDIKDFINAMSLVIFGGIVVSAVFTVFAYAFAINRRKTRPAPSAQLLEQQMNKAAQKDKEEAANDSSPRS